MVVLARPWRIVRSIRLSSDSGGGLVPSLAATCALGLMLAGVQPAIANSGISTFVPKKGDPDSMSANDFFKLIDKSIPKFKDMIVVIGGCYSSGFSDSAESSKAYNSGNSFALMAATDRKCPREEAGGSERGNSFVQGIVNGMYPGNNDVQKPTQPGTVTDGMTTAKSRIQRDATNKHAEPSNPTLVQAGGGANIRLGTGATSYHAILFSGVSANQAQTCADWYDVSKTWDLLVQSGYDPKNIKVMFGNGKRAEDGSPALLGEDQKPASSVKQMNEKSPLECPYDKETDKAGKPTTIKYDEASYAKLKEAIEDLQKAAAASPTEQYFIWSGSHNTTSANDLISLAPPPERPNRTPTGYVSTVPAMPVSTTTEQVSWTGGYLGAQLSGTFGTLETNEFLAATDVRTNHFEDSGSGGGAGITAGYNWRPAGSNVVVGPFASFDYLNQTINHSFPGGTFLGTSPRWVANVGVKAGVAASPNAYLYGLVAAAFLNQDLDVNFATAASSNVTTSGVTIGAGAEFRSSSWRLAGLPISLFVQYQHTWWDTARFDGPASSPAFNYGFRREGDTFKFGANLYFNPAAPPRPALPSYPVKALAQK
jgi:hypothetical protein